MHFCQNLCKIRYLRKNSIATVKSFIRKFRPNNKQSIDTTKIFETSLHPTIFNFRKQLFAIFVHAILFIHPFFFFFYKRKITLIAHLLSVFVISCPQLLQIK